MRPPRTIAELQSLSADDKHKLLQRAPNIPGIINARAHVVANVVRPTKAEYDSMEPKRTKCAHCDGNGYTASKGRHVGGIHPSAHYACPARQYYDVTGEFEWQEQLSTNRWFIYQVGHAMHGIYQDLLSSAEGVEAQIEVPVRYPSWYIENGHSDGVLEIDGYRILLELKSTSEASFLSMRSPDKKHVTQANIYAHALDVPFVCVLYGNKADFSQMKQFMSVYDPSSLDGFLSVITELDEAFVRKSPPQVQPKASECRACGYAHACPIYKKARGF